MDLPKIDLPIYELKLPSSGKTVRVRPFIVKEEKLLLIAVESKDENTIISTTKQIINNCLLDDVSVDKMPFFDVDYLFIALRAKSIGESVPVNFICKMPFEDKTCGTMFPVEIDISNCEVIRDDTITNDIRLSEKVSVTMKYPSYEVMKRFNDLDDALTKKIKIIVASIDRIFDGENMYTAKDFSDEQMQEYIEGMTEEQFKKLEKFVDNFPSFVINASGMCPRCRHVHNLKYTDFTSFFQ